MLIGAERPNFAGYPLSFCERPYCIIQYSVLLVSERPQVTRVFWSILFSWQGRPHSFALADRAQIAPASGKLRFLSETAGMFKKFALSSDDKEKPSSLWMKSSTTVYCYSPDSQDGFTVEPTASAGPRNSFFVKYLLNAIGGATKCYQPAEDKEVDPLRPDNPCNTCMKLNERIHNHAFLQLGEILSYASDHLKKHNMVYPKLIYNSGGNSLLFSFGGKAKVYPWTWWWWWWWWGGGGGGVGVRTRQ